MIGPFEDARGDLARWPAKWPGLDSPSARQRGDSYSIFLPGTEIAELRQFMQSGSQNSAAEIGGQKWAVSYRYTFPSEPVWFQVFAHEEEEAAEAEGSEDAEETEGMEGEPEDPEGAKPADDGENGDDADETQETDTIADDTGAGS